MKKQSSTLVVRVLSTQELSKRGVQGGCRKEERLRMLPPGGSPPLGVAVWGPNPMGGGGTTGGTTQFDYKPGKEDGSQEDMAPSIFRDKAHIFQ